jgi:hypothetical protein
VQEFSFSPSDPTFDVGDWRLSLQVVSFDNTYGIVQPEVAESGSATTVSAGGLSWAGGQRAEAGTASIRAERSDDGLTVVVSAAMRQRIRCTKLIVSGLPAAEIIGHRWIRQPVDRSGTVVHYPATTHTPLVFLPLADGTCAYFESLDPRVRTKRFAVIQRDDGVAVELIHEDAASEMTSSTTTPPWRIGRTADPESVVRRHDRHTAAAFGLTDWETRPDVPAWARGVALVVAIHGMHWTGYTFNTYDTMREVIDYISDRIEGRRVLAFLPGWEGRYYWQYGDYRPEPLLGGAKSFARLAQRARERGVHLMPMFGANCANTNVDGFARWGAGAEMRSASGLVFQGNRPDWDGSRAHDPGWQAWLNPGAPSWRQHLLSQVHTLVETYDLPAVFFDTQQVWLNDPAHDVYGGLVALRDELKARHPNLLVTGEGWYDALGAVTPMSQSGLPAAWPFVFAGYNRSWLHLSAGDPSRGSTGVHELGHNPFRLADDAPHTIPTLTVVDGTLSHGTEGVDAVIAQAHAFAKKYL